MEDFKPDEIEESGEMRERRERRAEALREQLDELKERWKEHSAEYEWWADGGSTSWEDLLPEEFDEVVPPEIRKHLAIAQREALIAFRGLLDYWIERSGGGTRRRQKRWENIAPL